MGVHEKPVSAIAKRPDFKNRVQSRVNAIFARLEAKGGRARASAFNEDYHAEYPHLRALEESWEEIRDECLELLRHRDRITYLKDLGGKYTATDTHNVEWRTFMLHIGRPIPENCALCPRTAALISRVPGVASAFFSILEPHQHISPHWGYYKGFLRYHLGLIIPNANEDRCCWIRINADPEDNALRDKRLIERGERYHWRPGRGVMFDDTNLHDAANESDTVRVILWLDVSRKLPLMLGMLSRLFLGIAFASPFMRKMRKDAVVRLQ